MVRIGWCVAVVGVVGCGGSMRGAASPSPMRNSDEGAETVATSSGAVPEASPATPATPGAGGSDADDATDGDDAPDASATSTDDGDGDGITIEIDDDGD